MRLNQFTWIFFVHVAENLIKIIFRFLILEIITKLINFLVYLSDTFIYVLTAMRRLFSTILESTSRKIDFDSDILNNIYKTTTNTTNAML